MTAGKLPSLQSVGTSPCCSVSFGEDIVAITPRRVVVADALYTFGFPSNRTYDLRDRYDWGSWPI